jgi:hypothetical protein
MAESRNLLSACATTGPDELEPLPYPSIRTAQSFVIIRAQQTDSPLKSIYEVDGSSKLHQPKASG